MRPGVSEREPLYEWREGARFLGSFLFTLTSFCSVGIIFHVRFSVNESFLDDLSHLGEMNYLIHVESAVKQIWSISLRSTAIRASEYTDLKDLEATVLGPSESRGLRAVIVPDDMCCGTPRR